MAAAWAIVALVAVPIGLAVALLTRRLGRDLLPPWHLPRTPWTGLDILLLIPMQFLLPSLAAATLGRTDFFAALYGSEYPPIPEGLIRFQFPQAAIAGGAAADAATRALAILHNMGLWGRIVAAP